MNADCIEFNRVTFALPTQAFKITAYISAEERLPAVTEFVLRLLHTCGRVSLIGLRDYFGFSAAEALSVIESMERMGQIKLDEDFLALSDEIAARFEASPDECPWVAKLKKRTDTVSFDLLAFTNLRRPQNIFATDNWIKLNPSADVVGGSVDRAKRAYRENFTEIEREHARYRGQERERSYGVHSIENVHANRPSFIPITIGFGVDRKGGLVTVLPEEFESGANPSLVTEFRDRINYELERSPATDNSFVETFLDKFQLDFLRKYVIGNNLDIRAFAQDMAQGLSSPSGVYPLFGSLGSKTNREFIALQINEARKGGKRAPKHLSSLMWQAPNYEFWGRGEEFKAAVDIFTKALKSGGSGDDLHVMDYAQERQEVPVRSKYANTGLDELHLVRPDILSAATWTESLELMLYPGQFAVAMIHAQLENCPGVRYSFGVLSTKGAHLRLVHQLLLERGRERKYGGRWPPKKPASPIKQAKSLADACTFLAFSDLGG